MYLEHINFIVTCPLKTAKDYYMTVIIYKATIYNVQAGDTLSDTTRIFNVIAMGIWNLHNDTSKHSNLQICLVDYTKPQSA